MKRYEASTPKAIGMLVALVMTVITLSLAVVIPATVDPNGETRPERSTAASTPVDRVATPTVSG